MKKPLEMYVTYLKEPIFGGKQASIRAADLRLLVKMAGLQIHRPDKGSGVVVINQGELIGDTYDPRLQRQEELEKLLVDFMKSNKEEGEMDIVEIFEGVLEHVSYNYLLQFQESVHSEIDERDVGDEEDNPFS